MVGLRVSTYQPNATMAPHSHEDCSFCVVINGTYREHIRDQHEQHGNGHMLFYPAGEVHSQEFGVSGSRKIIFTPQRSSLAFLTGRGVALRMRLRCNRAHSQLWQTVFCRSYEDPTNLRSSPSRDCSLR